MTPRNAVMAIVLITVAAVTSTSVDGAASGWKGEIHADSAAARTVARRYVAALRSDDGATLCELTSRAMKASFLDEAHQDGLMTRSCAVAARHDLANDGRYLEGLRVSNVTLDKHMAYAQVVDVRAPDHPRLSFELVEEAAGEWIVDGRVQPA